MLVGEVACELSKIVLGLDGLEREKIPRTHMQESFDLITRSQSPRDLSGQIKKVYNFRLSVFVVYYRR